MELAVLFINIIFSAILLGTGIFVGKKHSSYPDCSSGYHHKAAMESQQAWNTANRWAARICITEGILLFVIVPVLWILGLSGLWLLGIWMTLVVLSVLAAVFLPAMLLQDRRNHP
ncbi:MAG: SdpI family protein [Candidatus Merdivicinus sp.]|jgi:uncharacterized membrane protein